LWDNAELLEDLLHGEQVAHINSQDSWGRTPLHAAATTDNSRCLGVLLQAGGMSFGLGEKCKKIYLSNQGIVETQMW
jgi:ankyrin repeat protein